MNEARKSGSGRGGCQNHPAAACTSLRLYIAVVRLLPPSMLTATQSATLIAEATQIRNVLGC